MHAILHLFDMSLCFQVRKVLRRNQHGSLDDESIVTHWYQTLITAYIKTGNFACHKSADMENLRVNSFLFDFFITVLKPVYRRRSWHHFPFPLSPWIHTKSIPTIAAVGTHFRFGFAPKPQAVLIIASYLPRWYFLLLFMVHYSTWCRWSKRAM